MGEYLVWIFLGVIFNFFNRLRFSDVIWDFLMNRCFGF